MVLSSTLSQVTTRERARGAVRTTPIASKVDQGRLAVKGAADILKSVEQYNVNYEL